ncbi:MAG TPA: hypothetical protein DD417_05925 [Elusimicrobia bacterium]|nr:hypothetical protein [Elusimicrobiota bacterium]
MGIIVPDTRRPQSRAGGTTMSAGRGSVQSIIDEQVRRWELSSRERKKGRGLPDLAITISRLPGCAGAEVSRETARRLDFNVYNKEILHEIAESTHLSETVVRSLDEKVIPLMDEWITSLFLQPYLSQVYFHHLLRVLLTIGKKGHAVILGRGASFILPSRECLRVLFVAPLDVRIRDFAQRQKLTLEEAKRRILNVESDRRAFIRRHFHADMTDPSHYDIVLNTQDLGINGAVEAVQLAWETKRKVLAGGR